MQTTSFTQQISENIQQAVKTVSDISVQPELEHPTDPRHGDLSCNVAMVLFKQLTAEQREQFRSPKQFAEELVTELNTLVQPELVKEINVAGSGFINFRLSETLLSSYLEKILQNKWIELLTTNPKRIPITSSKDNQNLPKTAIVEYSSPNIAKPFTIGHLRSTIIGEAVANILQAVGWRVFRDNHLGDWGTQFGKQIYAILNIPLDPTSKRSNEEILNTSPEPVKELVQLYVEFHKQAEQQPELEEKAREWFKKLEDGDPEAKRLWQKCIDWSWKEFDTIYQRLGVIFTENNGKGYGESFFEDKMGPVIEELEQQHLLQESEGAKLVFLEKEHLPPLMIIKKDGATLYATRDLATDKFRKDNTERYGIHPIVINEVGAEQAEYFQQIYAVEYRLGWYKPGQRVHVKHGLYRFEDKKMSTRKGNVIWLADVLDEAVKRAKGDEAIGLGALKWNDLKRSAHLDVVFNWNEILSMDGNSGPYLQYAYARALSVLHKAGGEIPSDIVIESSRSSENEPELELLRVLIKYSGVVQRAAAEYAPHHVCTYLFELAQQFNSFYQKVPILRAKQQTQKQLRLQITRAVADTINHGLTILGIKVVEKM